MCQKIQFIAGSEAWKGLHRDLQNFRGSRIGFGMQMNMEGGLKAFHPDSPSLFVGLNF